MQKFKIVLGLSQMTVAEKVGYAQQVVLSMRDNPKFPNAATIVTKLDDAAKAADAALTLAGDKGLKAKSDLKIKLLEMEKRLDAAANHVEETANDDPDNGEDIVISASMRLKQPRTASHPEFKVEHTNVSGKVKLSTRYEARVLYVWEYMTLPATEWIESDTTINASHRIEGLTVGSKVAFRVAKIRNKEQEPWSNVIELVII